MRVDQNGNGHGRCWNWDARSYDVLPLPHGHWARRAIAQLRLNDNEMVLGGLADGVHPAWNAALFACGVGDGNWTRTISLGKPASARGPCSWNLLPRGRL